MKIIYGIISAAALVALLFLGYSLFQSNKATVVSKSTVIDSLKCEIKRLDSLHSKKDSAITVYKDSVVFVDRFIEKEKIKFVNLKHKMDEIRARVIYYTPTQLDSFFSSRYGDSILSNR